MLQEGKNTIFYVIFGPNTDPGPTIYLTLPPGGGGGNISRCHLGEKIIKVEEKKRENVKEKEERGNNKIKGEEKRRNKCKIEKN
jgi:hypothetical protein